MKYNNNIRNSAFTILLFLFTMVSVQKAKTQSLYIAYQDNVSEGIRFEGLAYTPIVNDWRNEVYYYFVTRYLYFENTKLFEVVSLSYTSTSLIPISSLSEYDIKTLEQLELELNGLTNKQRWSYFSNLDNIYIVELYPATSQARIVEVRINIDIE